MIIPPIRMVPQKLIILPQKLIIYPQKVIIVPQSQIINSHIGFCAILIIFGERVIIMIINPLKYISGGLKLEQLGTF